MKFYTLLIALLFTAQNFAQQITEAETIENQFNTLYRKSSSYQVYKVISKEKYKNLQKNVSDTINIFSNILVEKNILIRSQKNSIETLNNTVKKTNIALNEAIRNENSISLFGILITKKWYTFILFGIIFILIGSSLYFIFKFNNSNRHTVKAKNDLDNIENEFNIFKKKSIEREQKLRRELQDEIIKNRDN